MDQQVQRTEFDIAAAEPTIVQLGGGKYKIPPFSIGSYGRVNKYLQATHKASLGTPEGARAIQGDTDAQSLIFKEAMIGYHLDIARDERLLQRVIDVTTGPQFIRLFDALNADADRPKVSPSDSVTPAVSLVDSPTITPTLQSSGENS